MNELLLWIARGAGLLGLLLCVIAGIVRLSGLYWLAGFQVGTLLLAGIAALATACFCFLWVLVARSSAGR